ncbi:MULTISPECIES: LytR/AlgR family response regulator transcription factor [unclassified Enterococcus]|uniref:LytR/AlgR family response regulator transcription factor n=1 Tax=unclassified Enterococcus TaxID=2608891 RepID=UPI00041DF4FD
MTTRIFILEDSLIFEKTICEILEETKPLWKPMEYEIIHDFNPAQFMEFVRANEIRSNDLFFLDIDLNYHYNGLDIGEKIREKSEDCKIVYLTSHSDKAITAINQHVYPNAFIVKQMTYEQNRKEIQSFLLRLKKEWAIPVSSSPKKDSWAVVRYGNSDHYISYEDILYLESAPGYKNKVVLVLKDEELLVNGTIKKYKETLCSERLCKDLKAYLINIDNILSINRAEEIVTFKNKGQLTLGKRSIDKLKKFVQDRNNKK